MTSYLKNSIQLNHIFSIFNKRNINKCLTSFKKRSLIFKMFPLSNETSLWLKSHVRKTKQLSEKV